MLLLRVFFVFLAIISSVAGAPSALKKRTCTKPCVRKEWRAFSTHEKAAWIQAVNCLSHLPHDPALTPTVDRSISLIPPIHSSGSYYDDIVYIHMDLNTRIHFTGQFLPWHRWYVHSFEQALKKKCGYTGVSPYWNWTIDAPHFYESSFWGSNPESGLGGWGDANADFSVPDGASNFPPEFFPQPQKEANSSFLAPEIERLLKTPAGDYKGFQEAFESFEGAHGSVHVIMGGDLGGTCPKNAPSNCTPGSTWSTNDPIFWMHHAMVDKVWYDWQHRNPENAKSYFGGSVQSIQSVELYDQYPNGAAPLLNLSSTMPADGMFPEVTIGNVMDTTSGILCYIYE